jgi:predicted nucleotidyltransferase
VSPSERKGGNNTQKGDHLAFYLYGKDAVWYTTVLKCFGLVNCYTSAVLRDDGGTLMTVFPFDTEKLIQICQQNDVAMIGVFGSMARGEATEDSDIDLLVKFSKGKSLLTLVRLEREISTALDRKVDLLTEAAISPYLRDRIRRELKVIYES